MEYHVVVLCAVSLNFCDEIPRWQKRRTPVGVHGAVQSNVEITELALYKLI